MKTQGPINRTDAQGKTKFEPKTLGIIAFVVIVLLLVGGFFFNQYFLGGRFGVEPGKLPVMDMSAKVISDQNTTSNSFTAGEKVSVQLDYKSAAKFTYVDVSVKGTLKSNSGYSKSYKVNIEGDGQKLQELDTDLAVGRYQVTVVNGADTLSLVNFEIK